MMNNNCPKCKRLMPLTPDEIEEIKAFNESFKLEFHTGHLAIRLLRLPHSGCECGIIRHSYDE